MLVLGRKPGQRLFLTVPPSATATSITIDIADVDHSFGSKPVVRLAIDAPRRVHVLRDDAIKQEPSR
ncbi:MAG: carbon storage regulator [Acidiferrobacteraceae bacterium]